MEPSRSESDKVVYYRVDARQVGRGRLPRERPRRVGSRTPPRGVLRAGVVRHRRMLPGHGRDTRAHPEPATEIVMPDERPVSLDLPDGLPPWLAAFVLEAQRETDVLRDNGAEQAAAARVALLRKLIAAAQLYFDTELDAAEAASE